MRYAYGVTSALLLGGAAISLVTGIPAGAQEAQNAAPAIGGLAPKAGAPGSFADLTAQLQPAVVNIATKQKIKVGANPLAGILGDQFGGNGDGGVEPNERGGNPGGGSGGGGATREAQSLGSGFIVSADGYIVTNYHVIAADGAGVVESITVTTSDGAEYTAKIVGKDAASDLAVLKITGPKIFPFVTFGNSQGARVGDWVIAIGNPFGLGGTVTAGIISAVYRNTGAGGAYDRYLQTDASINRGNSGGPMFDMRGQVIGINNAIFSPTGGSVGIGFAIPAETAAPIVDKLIKGLAIERGYLGVQISALTEEAADSLGLPHNRGELIQSTLPGGAAAAGGVEAGDVVLKVNNKDVTPDQSLSFMVANTAPGTRIPLEVMRDGKRLVLTVTVGKRPSEEELAAAANPGVNPGGPQRVNPIPDDPFGQQGRRGGAVAGLAAQALGLGVTPLTPALAQEVGIAANTSGLLITGVDSDSDAGAKGIQRADVILSVNNRPVTTTAALEAIIREAKAAGRPAVLLRVLRKGQPPAFLPIQLR